MIKVIKPGNKDFTLSCSRCGCIFSYTLDELIDYISVSYIKCPECGMEHVHENQAQVIHTLSYPTNYDNIWHDNSMIDVQLMNSVIANEKS